MVGVNATDASSYFSWSLARCVPVFEAHQEEWKCTFNSGRFRLLTLSLSFLIIVTSIIAIIIKNINSFTGLKIERLKSII